MRAVSSCTLRSRQSSRPTTLRKRASVLSPACLAGVCCRQGDSPRGKDSRRPAARRMTPSPRRLPRSAGPRPYEAISPCVAGNRAIANGDEANRSLRAVAVLTPHAERFGARRPSGCGAVGMIGFGSRGDGFNQRNDVFADGGALDLPERCHETEAVLQFRDVELLRHGNFHTGLA
jgi:hypothetical protein